MKTKKREATKETQTEKPPTRNVMVGTVALQMNDKDVQVELISSDPDVPKGASYAEENSTPVKQDESHFTLEECKSLPVSPCE